MLVVGNGGGEDAIHLFAATLWHEKANMAYKGKITQWYQSQGYGYITLENSTQRIKFEFDALKNITSQPSKDAVVRFTLSQDRHGNHHATQIERLQSTPLSLFAALVFVTALGFALYQYQYPRVIGWGLGIINLASVVIATLDRRAYAKQQPLTSDPALIFISLFGGWIGLSVCTALFSLPSRSFFYRLLVALIIGVHFAALIWTVSERGLRDLNGLIAEISAWF